MTSSLLALLLAPSGQGGSGLSVLLFQVALIFGIFYFLIIRPQRRQQQRHKELLAALQKGDLARLVFGRELVFSRRSPG